MHRADQPRKDCDRRSKFINEAIALANELTPPQQYEPQISDRINEAIFKGIEIEPSDRSQSVAEWLKLIWL